MRKRIGITFSSGFFGFFAHGGFLAAIRQLNIKPVAYSGSSSGAILAAMAACNMDEREIEKVLFNLKKEDFWDPAPLPKLLMGALSLFRGYTGYLTGQRFEHLLRSSLPARTIEQCQYPLAVVATNLTHMRREVFIKGDIAKAVAASGAVPGLFKPVEHNGSFYVDGGIVDKAPIEALYDTANTEVIVVHFLNSLSFTSMDKRFSRRWLTPWHIHRSAVDIARYEAYKRQRNLLELKGVEVIEVKTETSIVGPNKLDLGPVAYNMAKNATLKHLSKVL